MQDGETALHIASKRGYAEIVSQLLKAHAGPNIVDKVGIEYLLCI